MTAPARKTFSGLDSRKPSISPPHRQPNGDIQRPYETRAETRDEALATVLAQPHRRGFDDPGRHWAIGRLILDGVVVCPGLSSRKMIGAAERYDRAWADMRWVMDSRRPWINSTARRPRDPSPDECRDIEKAWGDIETAIRLGAGKLAVVAIARVIKDNPQDEKLIAWWFMLALPGALRALVKHFELDK